MAIPLWQLAFVLFPAIAILHLQVSPFTKVEESFNIQALHDILEYGVPIDDAANKFQNLFDHMTFPGAVPRTFIGCLVISGLAKPQIWWGDLYGRASQDHVRAVLGGMNAVALAIFGRQVERAYGSITASWYVVLQASQFHLWYYASRTLPNMFSFFLSTIALAFLLPNPTSSLGPVKRTKLALYLMTIATVIFRSELAILLAARCAWLLLKAPTLNGINSLIRTTFIPSIVPGALVALLLTISIDTYFWQSSTYLWPELSAFLSNIFPSKDSLGASAWGTHPFTWYLTAALPRLFMNQIFMVIFSLVVPQNLNDGRILDNLIPSFVYVLVYSILPHKETRFMFPVVPSLTLVAALTCTRLTINMRKSMVSKLLFYAAILSTVVMIFFSHAILLPLSAQNYPGGHALQTLHEYYHNNYHSITPLHNDDPSHPQIRVHLTNLALQSGVTRFLEQPFPQNHTSNTFSSASPYPPVKGYNSPQQPVNLNPIILPGDANHPALTIRPSSHSTPSILPNNRAFPNPTWIYDKSPSLHSQPSSPFHFLIIEDPSSLLNQNSWKIISRIKSVSSPALIRPDTNPSHPTHRRYNPPNTNTDDLKDYWTTFTPFEQYRDHETGIGGLHGTAALLKAMYPEFIAVPLIRFHDLLHDTLRIDWHLTRDHWVEVPLVTKLYILRNCTNRGPGCEMTNTHFHSPSHTPQSRTPDPTPQQSSTTKPSSNPKDADISLDTEPEPNSDLPHLIDSLPNQDNHPLDTWDSLGPLVVNKDGTLSRLDNWADMTVQERKRTVEYLSKRNLLRMEGEDL